MKTYKKITFADGLSCICEPQDVGDMISDSLGHTVVDVQLTEAQFNALPEFQN